MLYLTQKIGLFLFFIPLESAAQGEFKTMFTENRDCKAALINKHQWMKNEIITASVLFIEACVSLCSLSKANHKKLRYEIRLSLAYWLVQIMSKKRTLSRKAKVLKDASETKPNKEEVVKTMMRFMETVTWPEENGTTKQLQVRQCPNANTCKEVAKAGRIEFKDKSGYTNPYSHLLSCYCYGDEDALLDKYWEAKAEKGARLIAIVHSKMSMERRSHLPTLQWIQS